MDSAIAPIPIVLASTSPRRRDLLSRACDRAGVEFSWIDPGIEDADLRPGGVSPAAFCAALAHLKARAGCERLRERAASGDGARRARVVGADTICVLDGEIIGKAASAGEARRTIERFMGRAHEVVTGVAILMHGVDGACRARRIVAERATVRLGELGESQIEGYVASELWRGKAGAYNLLERIAAGWPLTFEGDPTCVVGLPMQRVSTLLDLGSEPARAVPAYREGAA